VYHARVENIFQEALMEPNPTPSTKAGSKTATVPAVHADSDAPIVLDMGRKSRKQIRRLRRGEGKLMNRITGVIDELKNSGTITAGAQPIIVVVREREDGSLLSSFGM
jgi:Family of unknown function (DUF6200)